MSTEIQESTLVTHLMNHSSQIGELKATAEANNAVVVEIKDKLGDYNDQLVVNNGLLAEHIKGVQTNAKGVNLISQRLEEERQARQECHEQNEKRIAKLEESPNFWKRARSIMVQTATTITSLAVLGGVMYQIAEALKWIPTTP